MTQQPQTNPGAKLLRAAEAVVAAWDHGDLAAAVRDLALAVADEKAGAP